MVATLYFFQVYPPFREWTGGIMSIVNDIKVAIRYCDFNGHPTSISDHSIIGFIAVCCGECERHGDNIYY